MLSDRKASKVLGITVLRAPGLKIDEKASKVLGTAVVRSGTDWETRVSGGSVDPRNRLRKGFLRTKVTPLMIGKAEGEKVSEKEGQKVVLSPKWGPPQMADESGPNLSLSRASSSTKSRTETLSSTAETFVEPVQELGLDCGAAPDDSVSETNTLGVVPRSIPSSRSPTSIGRPVSPKPYEVPASPTARKNPVLQKRREMIRSANKSVQILGVEARRAILRKTERENEGRIGWSGV